MSLVEGEWPSVTVAICTLNRVDCLETALDSLIADGVNAHPVEVVVVDNGSSDQTVRRAKNFREQIFGLRVLTENVRGLSRARNRALSEAQGEWIAFLDDDAQVDSGWLRAVVDVTTHSEPSVAAAGGPIIPIWEMPRPEWIPKELEGFYSVMSADLETGFFRRETHPWGANMAFRVASLRAVGGFPIDLGRVGNVLLSGEEAWVFQELRKRGEKIWFDKNLRVRHLVPATRLTKAWLKRRIFWAGVSSAVMALKRNPQSRVARMKLGLRNVLTLMTLRRTQVLRLLGNSIEFVEAKPALYQLGYAWGMLLARLK